MQLRCAVVTGGTRGIGAATVRELLDCGARVTVTARSAGSYQTFAATVAPKLQEHLDFFVCDFEDHANVAALETHLQALPVDILINNAGINKISLADEIDIADFQKIQRVNTEVPFRLIKAVVGHMAAQKWGRIVNITSIFGTVSKAHRLSYSTSKFALHGMTKALALDYAGDGVLVNAVGPGVIETELTQNVLGDDGIAAISRDIPLGRLGTPAEIAKLVAFLASEDNSYLTGQQVIIDGGYTSA